MSSPIYNTQTVFDQKLRKTIPDEYKLPEEVTILHIFNTPTIQMQRLEQPSDFNVYICSNINYPTLIVINSEITLQAKYDNGGNVWPQQTKNIIYITSINKEDLLLMQEDLLLMQFVSSKEGRNSHLKQNPIKLINMQTNINMSNNQTYGPSICAEIHKFQMHFSTINSPISIIFDRIYNLKQKNLNSEIIQQNIKLQ